MRKMLAVLLLLHSFFIYAQTIPNNSTAKEKPEAFELLQHYLNGRLTLSQKKFLNENIASKILQQINSSLSFPQGKNEAETEYKKRKEELRAIVLSHIQSSQEEYYQVAITKGFPDLGFEVSAGKPGKYVSEKGTLHFEYMGTPAQIKLSEEEAKIILQNWKEAKVTGKKKSNRNMIDFSYINQHLYFPALGKSYSIIQEENPFNPFTNP